MKAGKYKVVKDLGTIELEILPLLEDRLDHIPVTN